MKDSDFQAVEAYADATSNEQAIDRYIYEHENSEGDIPRGIPRPLRIASALRFCQPLWPLLTRLAVFGWWFPFFGLFTVFQASRVAWQLLFRKKPVHELKGNIAVAATRRMGTLLDCLPESKHPDLCLTLPWCGIDRPPTNVPCTPLLQWATFTDVFKAVVLAWRGARKFAQGNGQAEARLQTYTAFNWFFTWQVLARQDGLSSLWFGNHYDRWAVLFDRLPTDASRQLIQHGFAEANLSLKARLHHVECLFYFDDDTKNSLLKTVLPPASLLHLERLSPSIRLTAVERLASQKHVLLIGQPIDTDKEIALLTSLVKAFPKFTIWFKPHPIYRSQVPRSALDASVRIIDDSNMFPEVDVAISGRSWLGAEYSAEESLLYGTGRKALRKRLSWSPTH